MTKSNGIASLKQAAKLLNKHAPDGESLAYINPTEARILKAYGGSGIMTLAGIPSYEPWYEKLWGGITDAASWVGENIFGYGDQTVLDKSGKAVQVAGRSPFQDAISVYAFLRAKKDQEGLSSAEMSEFNRLNAQLTAGKQEFTGYTGGGEHLTAPTNVPETIEDVSVFKETTGRPDMITTGQAQGGRIGYNMGGIDTPFQGIGALNPRMGYAIGGPEASETIDMNMNWGDADTNVFTAKERFFDENPLKAAKYMKRESDDQAYWDEKEDTDAGAALFDQAMMMVEKGLARDLSHALQLLRGEMNQPMGAAYGGRIGAQSGGIMPLLNMGGMEKDYRQDGGFVPIGRKEKADDVPARLSKNEFVFTADAVRAAGGGDIDQGAQRMYNVMKNLEAGGEISEQSQGQA